MGCDCSKPKPGPNGNQKPSILTQALVASAGQPSAGSFTHVAPDGSRTAFGDLLGARAEVARRGGSIDVA